ncbi:hypothetical protein [Aquabacterium humicola]|uniref:hypothetical protein n=1 Tax=Aquabacterium humicola TaxID=3237377 RepID=UPI00254331CC|nr:hypothetical protein [Rubrivivax pictus]
MRAIGAIGPHNVVPVLARFRAQRPRVRIVVTIGDSRTVARRVLEGSSAAAAHLRLQVVLLTGLAHQVELCLEVVVTRRGGVIKSSSCS